MCGTFVKGSARDGASGAVGTCPTWLRQRSTRRTQDSRRPHLLAAIPHLPGMDDTGHRSHRLHRHAR